MEELQKKMRDWEEEGRCPPPFSPTAAAGSDGGGTGKKGTSRRKELKMSGVLFLFFSNRYGV
jgi:hypothetical protein